MHFEDRVDVQNDTLLEPGGSSIYKLHKVNGEIKFNKCSSTKNLSFATWLRQCLWNFLWTLCAGIFSRAAGVGCAGPVSFIEMLAALIHKFLQGNIHIRTTHLAASLNVRSHWSFKIFLLDLAHVPLEIQWIALGGPSSETSRAFESACNHCIWKIAHKMFVILLT